jgi:hypothetical protein
MSVAARKRRHESKMERKRAIKHARREQYKALAGTSRKTKKVVKRTRGAKLRKHEHAMPNCGNVGCKRCYPQLQRTAA